MKPASDSLRDMQPHALSRSLRRTSATTCKLESVRGFSFFREKIGGGKNRSRATSDQRIVSPIDRCGRDAQRRYRLSETCCTRAGGDSPDGAREGRPRARRRHSRCGACAVSYRDRRARFLGERTALRRRLPRRDRHLDRASLPWDRAGPHSQLIGWRRRRRRLLL